MSNHIETDGLTSSSLLNRCLTGASISCCTWALSNSSRWGVITWSTQTHTFCLEKVNLKIWTESLTTTETVQFFESVNVTKPSQQVRFGHNQTTEDCIIRASFVASDFPLSRFGSPAVAALPAPWFCPAGLLGVPPTAAAVSPAVFACRSADASVPPAPGWTHPASCKRRYRVEMGGYEKCPVTQLSWSKEICK